MVVGFFIGFFDVPVPDLPADTHRYFAELSRPEQTIALLLILPVLWLTVLIHELGHVAAGRLVGFRMRQLTVGPLLVRPLKRGLGFKYNWLGNKMMGLAEADTDTPEDPRLERKHAVFVAGGPLASLLLAAVSSGLVALSGLGTYGPDELSTWELWGLLGLSFTGAVSAWLTLVSLLPFCSLGCSSDGLQLLSLWSRKAAFVEELRQGYRLQNLFNGQTELASWDLSALAYYDERDDLRSRYISALGRYYRSHNRGDIAAAKTYLDAAFSHLEALNSPLLALLHFEKAGFYAFHLGDKVTAQKHFDAGRQKHGDPDARRTAKTALLLVEGRYGEALRLSEVALRLLDRERDSGYNRAARHWVVAMRARAVAGEALRDERPAS